MSDLATGREVDAALRWPAGHADRLARRNKLPHYVLPDGSRRFKLPEIMALVRPAGHVAEAAK